MRRGTPDIFTFPALALAAALSLAPPGAAAQTAVSTVPTPSTRASFLDLAGMLSLQSSARFDTRFEPFLSLRFIPELKFTLGADRKVTIDGEASANAYGSALFMSDVPAETSGDIKPYRGWIRLSTSRFEARVGLQKVTFGSATVFRPMMWFDSLDPRDPLQLTEGVYALLLRYYTKGNANFWAWTMYGNDARRGFDLTPPDRDTPEFGGRIQVPFFKGELAATYHRRKTRIDDLIPVLDPPPPDPLPPVDPVPEDRFGLDGKWDIGVGFWLEGALVHQRTPLLPLPYQLSLAAGLDYTFALGRGLHVLGEHFRLETSAGAFAAGQLQSLSALFVRYPLGLSDELTGILYYDWTGRNLYRFLSWRRTSDALTFTAMVFWNAEDLPMFPGQPGSSSFAGTGLQLVLAYYF
jgi:hypothetical protein